MQKHIINNITPPPTIPLVLSRSKSAYKDWHDYLINLKRVDRYTVGTKIDTLFTEILEIIFRATFAYDKFEKISLVSQVIGKSDLLRFFLQIAWEHQIIDHKIYASLILSLDEIGRMLGGWKKSLQEKTPTK
jgi:hypothetical protein